MRACSGEAGVEAGGSGASTGGGAGAVAKMLGWRGCLGTGDRRELEWTNSQGCHTQLCRPTLHNSLHLRGYLYYTGSQRMSVQCPEQGCPFLI